jgi:CRP-like cAMP-binding protein
VVPIKTFGPREIFGEMALIENKPRSATATALVDTECYVITPHAFEEKLDAIDPFMRGLFRVLSSTIRDLTKELTRLKKDEVDGAPS